MCLLHQFTDILKVKKCENLQNIGISQFVGGKSYAVNLNINDSGTVRLMFW